MSEWLLIRNRAQKADEVFLHYTLPKEASPFNEFAETFGDFDKNGDHFITFDEMDRSTKLFTRLANSLRVHPIYAVDIQRAGEERVYYYQDRVDSALVLDFGELARDVVNDGMSLEDKRSIFMRLLAIFESLPDPSDKFYPLDGRVAIAMSQVGASMGKAGLCDDAVPILKSAHGKVRQEMDNHKEVEGDPYSLGVRDVQLENLALALSDCAVEASATGDNLPLAKVLFEEAAKVAMSIENRMHRDSVIGDIKFGQILFRLNETDRRQPAEF